MNIPFYRPSIGQEEIDEVTATLKSGWLTTGPRTRQFEKEFGEYLKQQHAIAVNSCTAALHLALEAIGIKASESVVVPTMTFAATAEVVRYLGARPLLVDCKETDFNLDVADAENRIQKAISEGQQVRAIMPVHYGGQVADVSGVRKLAQRFNLKVVEDAAHCCPAYYRGDSSHSKIDSEWLPVGTAADISCYSFYANKTITTGEGGMACTNNDEFAERMRIMSLHGISKDAWKRFTAEGSWYYEILAPGFKYNLTDIASAIGIHQLRKADLLHRKRKEGAALYTSLLKDIEELRLPSEAPGRVHSWHLYGIRLKLDLLTIDRATFITELHRRGVGTSVHWMPLHMHPYYRDTYGYSATDLPVAARLYPEIVTLPLYPDMEADQIRYVADSIRAIIVGHRRGAHHASPTPV